MPNLTLPRATPEGLAEARQWAGIDPVHCDPPVVVIGDFGTWIRWVLGLFD